MYSSKRNHSDADKPARNLSKAAIAVEGFSDVYVAGVLACHAGGHYPKEGKGRTEGQIPKRDRICGPQQELDVYAKFLQQDLQRAGNDLLDYWEEESSMTKVDSMYDGVDPTRISSGTNECHLLSEKDNDEEDLEDDEEDPVENEEEPEDNEDLEEDYGEEG